MSFHDRNILQSLFLFIFVQDLLSDATFHKEKQEPHTVIDCLFLVGKVGAGGKGQGAGGRGQGGLVLIYLNNDW